MYNKISNCNYLLKRKYRRSPKMKQVFTYYFALRTLATAKQNIKILIIRNLKAQERFRQINHS